MRDETAPKTFEFLTDDIGLPGREVQFEVFADLLDDDDEEGGDLEVSEVLAETAASLAIYAKRTGQEKKVDDDEEEDEENTKVTTQTKKRAVKQNDDFDMKSIMDSFITRMMDYLLTPKSAAYLNLTPEYTEPLDSDDELPPEFAKIIPSSQKRDKMLKKKEIPSFANLSADMARIRISEFFNPSANIDPLIGGTTVDVRREQEKILVAKIDQKIKAMASSLKLNKEETMEAITEFVHLIRVDSEMVCLRQAEAKLVTIVILFLGNNQF